MTPQPLQFIAGSRSPRTVFVGEAWGATEDEFRQPFAGESGREFARMLGEAWSEPDLVEAANSAGTQMWLALRQPILERMGVMLTNVFPFRPNNNNLAFLCTDKGSLPEGYTLAPVRSQSPRYVKPEYLPELTRLRSELESTRPNLVVALGGTATWSLLGSFSIGSLRGATCSSTLVPGQKLLPTYHPAGVLYQWGIRGTVIADLLKAKGESSHADIRRPAREITVNPTMEFLDEMVPRVLAEAKILAPDVETMKGQIRCIGFAWRRDAALVIPFIRDLKGNHYWEHEELELRAWKHVRTLLESPVPKVGQNFLFDLQYLTRAGIHVRNVLHDTMLLHHVLYPELPKSLGFLGSVYCNEQSWKLLRKHGEELKRDE